MTDYRAIVAPTTSHHTPPPQKDGVGLCVLYELPVMARNLAGWWAPGSYCDFLRRAAACRL